MFQEMYNCHFWNSYCDHALEAVQVAFHTTSLYAHLTFDDG